MPIRKVVLNVRSVGGRILVDKFGVALRALHRCSRIKAGLRYTVHCLHDMVLVQILSGFTYVENLGDLNEVRVANHFVRRTHLKHDEIIGTSGQLGRDSTGFNQLRTQDIQDGIKDEFEELDPVALGNPGIDTIDAGRDKVPLVGLCAAFERARNVVGSEKNDHYRSAAASMMTVLTFGGKEAFD